MLRAREAELCGVGVISKLLAGKRIPCLELVVVELQRKVDLGGVAGGEERSAFTQRPSARYG